MEPFNTGKLIKELRIKHHMTQREFAEELGVTYQAVSKWENGKNMPDILLLKEISKLFDVDIDELLTGERKVKENSSKKAINRYYKGFVFIFIVLVVIVLFILFMYFKQKNDFEFKKMVSNCDEFTLDGSAAYNQDKTSIYISNVDYCGKENNTLYQKFDCTLYESYRDTRKEIGTCGESNEQMLLDDFLDTVTINVNNYVASCRMFTSSTLYLEIIATDEFNKNTTYQIPIRLEENCKK